MSVLVLIWPGFAYSNGWEHTTIPMPVLIAALADPSAEIRLRAADSLGYRHQDDAVEHLVTLINKGESDLNVRQTVYQSLGRIGSPRATPILGDCLEQESQESVRAICVTALGLIQSGDAEPLVIDALADRSSNVRNAAITALGNFSSDKVTEKLVAQLNASDQSLHIRAIAALGRSRNPAAISDLLPLIGNDIDEPKLIETLKAVAAIGAIQSTERIERLYATTTSNRIRRYALMALSSTREDGAEKFAMEALSADDPLVRLQGLEVLRENNSKASVRKIAKVGLHHSKLLFERPDAWYDGISAEPIVELSLLNEFLRTVIALDPRYGYNLFASVSSPSTLPKNNARMLQIAEGFYRARWQGLYALGYTFNPGAESYLKLALTDPDPRIRAVALRSIGVYGAKNFKRQVIAAGKDNTAEVRWTAARVLGRDRQSANVGPLLSMLGDRDATVRKETALSLGYLGNHQAIDALNNVAITDTATPVREAASFALSLLKNL